MADIVNRVNNMLSLKEVNKEEAISLNKELCKEYPFLACDVNIWTGKKRLDYDYSYTWYDDLPSGWRVAFGEMLLEELASLLDKANFKEKYEISQIKEKYGSLRWYSNGVPAVISDEYHTLMSKYENLSGAICICCGKPDVRSTTGWITPVCYDCWKNMVAYKGNEDMLTHKDYLLDTTEPDRMPDKIRWSRYNGQEWKTEEVDISETADKIREAWRQRVGL